MSLNEYTLPQTAAKVASAPCCHFVPSFKPKDDRMMTLSKEERIPDRMMDLSKEERIPDRMMDLSKEERIPDRMMDLSKEERIPDRMMDLSKEERIPDRMMDLSKEERIPDRMMTLPKEERIPDRMMDLSKEERIELVLLSGREEWSYRKIAEEFNLDTLIDETKEAVMAKVSARPKKSLRRTLTVLGVPKPTTHKMLVEEKFHRYNLQILHHLNEDDPDRRM
ncbi:Hypothetical predicted protein [Octopus vulgaris]|uniref:Uncharacterized protein n=1 Tax=Octopus vulgaris TaxID=6645 RepID=A0AA36FCR8_OCTVU|nr:Hypothetical predicted protein [Octopus vulgaris]